ncbi:MAG TPA: hypothetical protein VGJ28_19385 [Micromonosporaceae bacterium]
MAAVQVGAGGRAAAGDEPDAGNASLFDAGEDPSAGGGVDERSDSVVWSG